MFFYWNIVSDQVTMYVKRSIFLLFHNWIHVILKSLTLMELRVYHKNNVSVKVLGEVDTWLCFCSCYSHHEVLLGRRQKAQVALTKIQFNYISYSSDPAGWKASLNGILAIFKHLLWQIKKVCNKKKCLLWNLKKHAAVCSGNSVN